MLFAAALVTSAMLTATPPDLELHAAASALISADLYALTTAKDAPVAKRLLIAGGVTLGIGAAKELLWDGALHQGTASWQDFAADTVGTIGGLALSWAIDQLIAMPGSSSHP